MTLQRRADRNQILLKQQEEDEERVPIELDTDSFLTSVKNASQNSKQSEIVAINQSNSSRKSKKQLSVEFSLDSFDLLDGGGNKISRLTKTPPIMKRSHPKTSRNRTEVNAIDEYQCYRDN